MHPAPGQNRLWVILGITVVVGLVMLVISRGIEGQATLPTVTRGNGQQWIIEAVTYQTNVVLGHRSLLVEWFGRWLPQPMTDWLSPARGRTEWSSEQPELVVWLNGFDPAQNSFIDCQECRLEFIDDRGDLFPASNKSWYGFNRGSRVASGFPAFPRRNAILKLRLTSRKTLESHTVTFPNPNWVTNLPAWTPTPLPAVHSEREVDLILSGFDRKTNGGPDKPWETPSQHWIPRIELRSGGQLAEGWLTPEWSAEDPTGNRGQALGLHEPIQRFHVLVFPSVTNSLLQEVAVALPQVDLRQLGPGLTWSLTATTGPVAFDALGVLPAGVHTFTERQLTTNPPPYARMAPVTGGSPSGWVSMTASVTPTRKQAWYGHYTPVPTLYLRAPTIPGDDRMGVRVRDEKGRLWAAEPEEQGRRDDIRPFLLRLPPEVQVVTPEVVFLRPLAADFTVAMPPP